MIRVLLTLLLSMFSLPVFAQDFNSEIPQMGDSPEVYSTAATNNNTAIDRTLFNYRQGAELIYGSGASVIVTPGVIACNSNTGASDGRKVIFRSNTANVTATTANLDTGSSFSASTTYYVYGQCDSSGVTTFTVLISLNSTTPTGATNYVQMGTFTTDSATNVSQITNANYTGMSQGVSKSVNTIYQATTDGFITISGDFASSGNTYFTLKTDVNPTPTAVWGVIGEYNIGAIGISLTMTAPIVKGNYYEVIQTGLAVSSVTYYFTPYGY